MRLRDKPYTVAVVAGSLLFSATIIVLWLARTMTEDAAPREPKPVATWSPAKTSRPKAEDGSASGSEGPPLASRFLRDGKPLRPTAEQIDAHLASRNRNLDSLLSAFRITGYKGFLTEALERFPDDPRTVLAALPLEKDPDRRLEMVEAFKRAEPGNAMGNCLAARALLDMGRKDEALAELQDLAGKPFDDFSLISLQADEEVYLEAGIPPVEARMNLLYSQNKPHTLQIRKLGTEIAEMREAYRSSGDEASAEALLEIQTGLGRQMQDGDSIIDSLVGMALEKQVLKDIDSDEARARLQEIDFKKEAMNQQSQAVSELMKNPEVPESDWLLYFDRTKLFGEAAANNWMIERHPSP